MEKLKTDDLLQLLAQPANGRCTIILVNGCPPEWRVVILSGGVKFFYRDGTDHIDGPRPLNLGSGQSAAFFSNDANKCVHQFFLAMNVKAGDEDPITMTHQDGVEAGKCLLRMTITLGPKRVLSEVEIGKEGGIGLLEFTVS